MKSKKVFKSDVRGSFVVIPTLQHERVIDEISDDHFNGLQGKPGDGGRVCCRGLRRGTPRLHWSLATVQCQTRLASSSITVIGATTQRDDGKWAVPTT